MESGIKVEQLERTYPIERVVSYNARDHFRKEADLHVIVEPPSIEYSDEEKSSPGANGRSLKS